QAHEFSSPLSNRVVVKLLDRNRVRNFFLHEAPVIPVDLSAAEKDETKLQTFLQADQILRAYCVREPQVLIVVLPIPTSVLRGEMVDVVEPTLLKNTLKLPQFPDVASHPVNYIAVVAVARRHLMTSCQKLANEMGADETTGSSHENVLRLHQGLQRW